MSVRLSIATPNPDLSRSLASGLGVHPLVGQLLINRGVTDADAARRFIRPALSALHDPALLPGMEQAVEVVSEAVRAGRRITIYGDYDVDGVSGTSTLWRCLRLAGADVTYYVPHRVDEGYGLNTEALEQLAADGTAVVVTVDCGITAVEPVRRAKELGLAVVITDHHEPGAELPPADSLVHPRLEGSAYPFGELSGAGVAFKLAWALGQRFNGAAKVSDAFREFLVTAMAMVALGTVADVVPLVDENRVLVHHGLRAIDATANEGIKALIEVSGLGGGTVDAFDIGFRLGPRLNAIGRLGHARLAVELMTTDSADRAMELAKFLDQQNRQRQSLERRIFHQAAEQVEAELDLDATPAICLAHADWHAGVIGIVASRLVDRFYRPTILVSMGEDSGQGSGRSVAGFNLLDAIRESGSELTSFGGHAYAAGLRVEPARFEAFRDRFYEVARQWIDAKDLAPEVNVDAEVSLSTLTVPVLREIERLAPFGQGNPTPVLVSRPLDIVGQPRQVGRGDRHLSFMVRHDGAPQKAIAFGMGDRIDEALPGRQCELVYEPSLNHWQGRTSVDLKVKHLRMC